MSLIGTVANYGGKQPTNTQNIKQFVVGPVNNALWIYKKINTGISVQTPANSNYPVYINNDLYVTGSIYNTSDVLLKENIVKISDSSMENLLNLEPVEYSFKSDMNKNKHYGLIAQDVEKLFPELVKDNVLGYKTVNYIELLPIILSKMKSMQKEMDGLKESIQLLNHDDT
jgi:hypothetical protein